MKTILTQHVPGACSVVLQQAANRSFTVKYGQAVTRGLTYVEAAKEYGECVLHALACAGVVDADPDEVAR